MFRLRGLRPVDSYSAILPRRLRPGENRPALVTQGPATRWECCHAKRLAECVSGALTDMSVGLRTSWVKVSRIAGLFEVSAGSIGFTGSLRGGTQCRPSRAPWRILHSGLLRL